MEDWDRLHAINTRGTFLCYKAAAIQMIKQGRGGRIIGQLLRHLLCLHRRKLLLVGACSVAGMKGKCLVDWGVNKPSLIFSGLTRLCRVGGLFRKQIRYKGLDTISR